MRRAVLLLAIALSRRPMRKPGHDSRKNTPPLVSFGVADAAREDGVPFAIGCLHMPVRARISESLGM